MPGSTFAPPPQEALFAYAAVEAVAELAMAAGCLAIGLRSRRMQPPTSVGKALHNAS